MLIDTKKLSDEEKKNIEDFLNNMGVQFTSDKEKSIVKYLGELKEEYESVVCKTNWFNEMTINLAVKAAIPQHWIGPRETLEFYFYSTVKCADNESKYCFFWEKNLELTGEVEEQEEIEGLLCYLKEVLELDFDFTFSGNYDEFSFDSEQEKLVQLF